MAMLDYFLGWLTPGTLVVFVLILVLTRHVMLQLRLPPGPWGLPYIGYVLFIDGDRRPQHIHELCQRHKTKVMSMTMFGGTLLFLDDYDVIKEVFQRRSDVADRPDIDFFKLFDDEYNGVVGTSDRVWREQRRFMIYMLRDFGMGKCAAETYIHSETQALMQVFRSHNGQPFDPHIPVNLAVSNVTNSMVFGKRFEYDDVEFKTALKDINEVVRIFASPGLYFLFKTYIGKNFLVRGKFNQLLKHYRGFLGFVVKQIEEHQEKYNGTVNDLIDGYLKEMEDRKDRTVFNEKNLQYVIVDVFVAGAETTTTTLRWALLYLAAYPELQEQIYREIREAVGDRLPTMNDKKNTPLTEATLCEIQRVNTLLVFGLGHTCVKEDFHVEGYPVPRGTPIAANLYQVHHDPRFWKRPDEFDPHNFLDDDGQVCNQDKLVQFSIGRRSCAGEALARMELYLFLTSWVQQFRFQLASDTDLEGLFLGVYSPKHYLITAVPR